MWLNPCQTASTSAVLCPSPPSAAGPSGPAHHTLRVLSCRSSCVDIMASPPPSPSEAESPSLSLGQGNWRCPLEVANKGMNGWILLGRRWISQVMSLQSRIWTICGLALIDMTHHWKTEIFFFFFNACQKLLPFCSHKAILKMKAASSLSSNILDDLFASSMLLCKWLWDSTPQQSRTIKMQSLHLIEGPKFAACLFLSLLLVFCLQ